MTTLSAESKLLRGVSTLITVDKRSSAPLYRQIYDSYRREIVGGDLRGGQLVPSSRELARALRISRLPVLNAYAQLLAEGYFEARVGAGTFVARSLTAAESTRVNKALPVAPETRPVSALAASLPLYEEPNWAVDLRPFQVGQPALDQFPVRTWARMLSRASRDITVDALRYGRAMGLGELRGVIATYLRTSRGVRCDADHIMIVSGSQQALYIATLGLVNPGDAVWIEEPGYWLLRSVLKGAGCRPIPVPVDGEGLNVNHGIKLARNARAAFVAPSHQFPLGVTMTVTRRLQLLDWARRVGAWIIEDDYDSEYRYDSMPIASLQGLDDGDRVIYVGTFSKVLFPSLRLGYMVIPRDLIERFTAVRQSLDLCPPHENQLATAAFIRGGHFARHIRRMRQLYSDRHRALVEAIEREFADSCTIVGADAGMHLTLLVHGLRDQQDQALALKALKRGLVLSPLSLFYLGSEPRSGFVLGFGNASVEQIPESVRLLKKSFGR